MAEHKVTFLDNEYSNQQTGQKARGVTVILDGKFGEVIEQLKADNPKYENNIQVIQDALFRGINDILAEQNGDGAKTEAE